MEVAMISQRKTTTNKLVVPKVIGGAGGSKGGGGGKEADDNLESTATLSIVELLGEGQIGGLVDKSPSSIFLNGTPLANSSGIYNFNNVKWAFVDGTQSQESLGDGYNEVENSYSVNSKVTKDAPVKFTITDPNADKVRAIVSVPTLMNADSKGNINGTHVEFRFSISLNNGPFKEIGKGKITGKTRTKYQREYSYELPKNTDDGKKVSMWTIQVERMTAESSKSSLSNDLFVDNYSVITASRLSYPNSAIVGISFDAEQFQGVPERSYLVDGLLIKVPSNRDNKTRKYTGTWDGTYKLAVCDNPAWILYDLLTNKRYGLGNYVPPEYANPARLYVIGKYCDEMVDNGFGELEPRFSINTCINTRMDAHQLISEVSSVFNGMTYWTGDQMGYMCDMPTPVTMRYTAANVIDGEFVYAGAQRKDIHSTVLVSWNDPENNYHTATEYVSDPEMVERFGIRTAEISAFGCTSRAQAVRVGRWLLHTERYQSKTISFKVGIDSAFVMPGDVIEILDPNRAGKRQGGRLVECSKTSALLDGEIKFEKGSNISIRLEDGTFADRIIEAVGKVESGSSKVTWKTPLTTLPVANALWVIKTPTLSPLAARVVAVGQGENLGEFSITAIQHNESKFDHIEKDMMLETPNITVIEPNLITAPKTVEISNESRIEQSLAVHNMVITWEQVKEAIGYEVVYRKGDGNWFTLPTTKMPLVEVHNVQQGTYTAKVTAISASGAKSAPAWSLPTEIEGQVAELPKLAWFKATPGMFSIELTWSLRSNTTGVSYTEIEVSEDDGLNFKPLTVIPDPAKEYVHNGLALGNKRTYRARLVDKYGFKSVWSDLASAAPDTDPSKVLEILEDQIGIPELNQGVKDSINSAAKEAQEATKGVKEANEKLAQETKARTDAIIAEQKARAADILAEQKARAADILKEQKANADALLKESRDRTEAIKNAATKEASDRNAAIKAETDARLRDVKSLKDGITKETQERKTEDGKILENVETFKASTKDSLASIQDKTTANATEIGAQAQRITGIDSRLKNTDKTANSARDAAATAQTTANTAVSKAEANASKISSVDASLSTTTDTADKAALLSKYQNGGKPMVDDPAFKNGTGRITNYNNGAINGTFSRELKQQDNPTESTHEVVRKLDGPIATTGIGWAVNGMVAKSSRVYLIKQIVKLPVGFKLDLRTNAIGTDGQSLRWLTNNEGTGKYETYIALVTCGVNGPFSTTGHTALTRMAGTPEPSPENPLIAYLASYEWWDCTAVNDTIPKQWRDEVEANAKAYTGIEARVTESEGLIKSQSKSFEQLKNDLTVTNEKVSKKAESSALEQTNSSVQKQGEELLAQAGKINSLNAAISTSAPEFKFTATADAVENFLTLPATGNDKVKLIDEPSAVSGKVLRIGTNAGNDGIVQLSQTYVPIDPEKLYRIRYRYRRVEGAGSTYIALAAANAEKTASITAANALGAIDNISGSNYFVVNQMPKLGEWAVGEAFIQGKSTGAATGNWTKASPRTFQGRAAFFRLGILPNYSGKPGIQDFDYVIIEDYDAMAANEATSGIVKTIETEVKNINGKVEATNVVTERITGQVKELENGIQKKADTEILKNYTTKTEMNQSIAKGIESYNAILSIGGQNILPNGDVVKNYTRWGNVNGTVSHLEEPELKTRIARITFTADGQAQGIVTNDSTMNIRAGVQYVASFLARASEGNPIAASYNYLIGAGATPNQLIAGVNISADKWARYEIAFTAARSGKFQLLLGSNSATVKGRYIDYAELQVQEGTKATEWTKPLSSIENSLDANAQAIQNTQAEVKNVDGKVSTNSKAIIQITGRVNTVEKGLEKKFDATAINGYYTKVETDKVVAGNLSEYNASLKIGSANHAKYTVDGRLFASGFSGAKLERTADLSRDLIKGSINPPFRLKFTGGTNLLKTTPQISVGKLAECVLSFKVKNEGPESISFNWNGFNHPSNGTTTPVYLKGKSTVEVGEELEIAVHGRMRQDFDWLQFQIRVPNLKYVEANVLLTDIMMSEGNAQAAWVPPYQDVSDSIDANASAIQQTETQVKNVDGKVEAHAGQLNSLKGEISKVDTKAGEAIKNAATAQTTANTAVSQNAVNANNIAELDASLNNMTIGGQNLWSVVDKTLINEQGRGEKTVINSQDEHYRITMKAFNAQNNLILSRHDSALEDRDHQIEAGQDYVYSFEIRANKEGLIHTVYAYFGEMRSIVSSNHQIGTAWTKFTFPFKAKSSGTASTNQLQGFAFSSNANHKWAVDDWYEIRHVQMQKGNKATEYTKATGSLIRELDANAKAIDSTNVDVKKIGQDVIAHSGKLTNLENSISETKDEVKKKADSTAVNSISTDVKKLGEEMSSQANSILKLEASYSSKDSDSLLPDYNLANPDCWTSHYGTDLTPHFKKTGSGKVTNTVVRKQAGDASAFFNYSKTPLPLDKAYKISMWVRRSADSDGSAFITGMYGKKNGSFSPSSYYAGSISASIPSDETWTYIERIVDLRAVSEANPQIKFGFALGHTGSKGWWEMQGYSVKAVLSEGDVDSTLATAKALSETNSAVKKTENAIDSLSKSTLILQNNLEVSGKAGTNLLIESNKVLEYIPDQYPHARIEMGVEWEVGAKYTLVWCAEHQRGEGDTNSVLAAYAGGGNQQLSRVTNGSKQVQSVTFTKSASGTVPQIHIYMLNRPTADKKTVGVVYWAVLVKGEFATTDEWIPSQYDFLPQINAASEAIRNVESQVKSVDGKVESNNKATDQLKGRVDTVEKGLKTKAESSALLERYTKTETDKAIAGKIESYDASLNIGGTNLLYGTDGRNLVPYAGAKLSWHSEDPTDMVRVDFNSNTIIGAMTPVAMQNTKLVKGKTYTLSFIGQGTMSVLNYIYIMDQKNGNTPLLNLPFGAGGNTLRSITFEWTKETTTTAGVLLAFSGATAGQWFTARSVMLEEATKPSSWSPNPQETKNSLEANASAIKSVQTEVKKVDDKIVAQTKQSEELKSQIDKTNASLTKEYLTKTETNSAIASASTTLKSEVKKDYQKQFDELQLDRVTIPDTRNDDQPPIWYWTNYPRSVVTEFKFKTAVGGVGPSAYGSVETIVPWTDASGGQIVQKWTTANEANSRYRFSVGSGAAAKWSEWGSELESAKVQINEQSKVIDGVKAVKSVTVDNNGMLSGWGLLSELVDGKVRSTIGFKADQIYFESPADGRKPFIITTTTTEVNGVTYPPGAWIDSAYIANASIKLAHIDKASIGSLSALSATIGTLRTREWGSRLEIRDNILEVFDDNNQVRVQLGVLG